MFAAHQQENLINAHQTAAAAKQLNQGKAPGNKAPKTPFKIPLNDENATFGGGKSVLRTNRKGNENLLTVKNNGGKAGLDAFVTPAGPRSRAPLGMKTTNAKAKAFQTPAPMTAGLGTGKTQLKSRSPRLHRPKVKVLPAEPIQERAQDVEPEIEYMPPRGEPLPDHPDWLAQDLNLEPLKGANLTRGAFSAYMDPIDDDGMTQSQREAAQAREKETDEMLEKAMADSLDISTQRNTSISKSTTQAPVKPKVPRSNGPSTLNSRSAATLLSYPRDTSKQGPSFAAPTASAKARLTRGINPLKKAAPVTQPAPSRTLATRHAAASNSTIGYAQSRTIRKPLSGINFSSSRPAAPSRPASIASTRSTCSDLTITPGRYNHQATAVNTEEQSLRNLQLASLNIDNADSDDDVGLGPSPLDPFEEDLEDFVLAGPSEL